MLDVARRVLSVAIVVGACSGCDDHAAGGSHLYIRTEVEPITMLTGATKTIGFGTDGTSESRIGGGPIVGLLPDLSAVSVTPHDAVLATIVDSGIEVVAVKPGTSVVTVKGGANHKSGELSFNIEVAPAVASSFTFEGIDDGFEAGDGPRLATGIKYELRSYVRGATPDSSQPPPQPRIQISHATNATGQFVVWSDVPTVADLPLANGGVVRVTFEDAVIGVRWKPGANGSSEAVFTAHTATGADVLMTAGRGTYAILNPDTCISASHVTNTGGPFEGPFSVRAISDIPTHATCKVRFSIDRTGGAVVLETSTTL